MLNNKKKNHYKNSNTQIVRSEKMLKTGKTKSKQMGKHKFTHTKIERKEGMSFHKSYHKRAKKLIEVQPIA